MKAKSHAERKADAEACETLEEMQEKMTDVKDNFVSYVKENPIKAIGISVLAGMFVAQLFSRNK